MTVRKFKYRSSLNTVIEKQFMWSCIPLVEAFHLLCFQIHCILGSYDALEISGSPFRQTVICRPLECKIVFEKIHSLTHVRP